MRAPSPLAATVARALPAALACLLALAPGTATALEYSNVIAVEDEDGVYQMYENGLINEEERDRLLDLLRSPVDLNAADRDELYELPGLTYGVADAILKHRKKHGDFAQPEDVLDVPGFPDELWEQIMPFVEAGRGVALLKGVSGRARLRGNGIHTFNPGDTPDAGSGASDPHPGFAQQTDLKILERYNLGWTFLLQDQLAPVAFYPGAGTEPGYFVSDGTTYVPGLQSFRAYATARAGHFDVIGGFYRVGFGQGLVFNSTTKTQPWGWLRDQQLYENYQGAGFRMPRGQRGLAVTAKAVDLGGDLTLDAAGFVSFSDDDAYQYDFGHYTSDPAKPDDPPEFSSYALYEGGYGTDNRMAYQTLPRIYHELLGGGAVRLNVGSRHHVGVAGYGARILWRPEGDFAFSQSAPYPEDRTTYGAFGASFETGYDLWTLTGEVALMDNLGSAAYLSSLLELDRVALRTSLRSYSLAFDNPHSRGRADLDEYRGDRDRDERGGEVLAVVKLPWKVRLSGSADVWQRPSLDVWNGEFTFRTDWDPRRWLNLAAWLYLKDKDLTRGGRGQSYDGTDPEDPPAGMRWYWAVQAGSTPLEGLSFSANYKRALQDTTAYPDAFEPSQTFWARAAWRFLPGWGVAARVKYYDEDTLDDSRGSRYWEVYGELEAALWRSVSAKVRYTWQHGNRVVYDTDESGHVTTYADLPSFHHVKGMVEVRF